MAYQLMCTYVGSDALESSGITSPADLLRLPSDDVNGGQENQPMSSEQVDDLRRKIKEYNEAHGFK